ncbi:hypothetical protein KSS87_009521 [Heliosperma pusillum]|nr:hypothetical protein KSS87_009521 [Heliosperma pusillum]
MVLVTAFRDYINNMLQHISGIKVLILDSLTVSVVSVAYSQSDLLKKEVFLVEMIDSISMSKESMLHLKAVCFLRPTLENVQHLRRQLICPRFGEYHLFFSNILKDTQIQELADSDKHETVQQVQEFYADFVSVDCCHFSLNIPSNHLYMVPVGFICRGVPALERSHLQRYYDLVVEGISAVFLALKRRPFIRYQQTSDIAKLVAQSTAKFMYERESGRFDFKKTDTLLLILDRRGDPFTPLLNQWTYQAMVHELIGIKDNKVDLRNVKIFPMDQQEVVLSSDQDAFFKAYMYENFKDIGINLKEMVDEFQQTADKEIARFVDNYPEFRKVHCNVSKHVTLVTEMSKIVEDRKLMLVSQTEQKLACNEGQAAAFEALTNLINNDNVSDIDQLRSLILYVLHYEKEYPSGELIQLSHKLYSNTKKHKGGVMQLGSSVTQVLLPFLFQWSVVYVCSATSRGVRSLMATCLSTLLRWQHVHFLVRQACVHDHTWDLFRRRDLTDNAHNMASGLKVRNIGWRNVHTHHQPLLYETMESISMGQLNDAHYPFVGNHFQQGRPQDVVIFIVGGTTYAESRAVALFNSRNSGIRFILGGTTILNSERFLKDVEEAGGLMRASIHCGY